MHKTAKWMIGGGLATTFIIIAGMAVALVKHDHHHDGERSAKSHMHKGHKGYHHMRFGPAKNGRDDRTLDALQSSLSERFSGLDTNGDGMLSAEEFSAQAIARFMMIDADGDGTLTREEMKKARKDKKGKSSKSKSDAQDNRTAES
jgi:hypothetical protein